MTIITNIFSALGNNSSLTPIIVKDSFDITGRTTMAYKQGSKAGQKYGLHDAREMFLEETLTSCIWLGGIPALKVLFDKFVTNRHFFHLQNLNKNEKEQLAKYGEDAFAKIDLKLLDENSPQALKKANVKGTILEKPVTLLLENKAKFKNHFFFPKAIITTLIPLALIGFVLPKLNYALTGEIVKREKAKSKELAFKNLQDKQGEIAQNNGQFAAFMGNNKANNKVAFGSMGERVASFFMNPVYNMAVLDAGITTGRVTCARNIYEAVEKGIKEAGIIFFMYLGGKHIAKALEAVSKKVFKTPIELDSKILEDKRFIVSLKQALKNKTTDALTAFTKNDEASIIQFIDKELSENKGVFKNKTLAEAQKIGLINVVDGQRNPLHIIDTEKVAELNKKLVNFIKASSENKNGIKKFVKKAINLKRGMVVANLAICSTALAFILPKVQYLFREKATKSAMAPGLGQYYK